MLSYRQKRLTERYTLVLHGLSLLTNTPGPSSHLEKNIPDKVDRQENNMDTYLKESLYRRFVVIHNSKM